MEINLSFGYWVRRRRKALDLTQTELARQVACTLSTIKKIELDERRPSILMAERLTQILQIPPAERASFIEIARAVHSPDRLALDNQPRVSERRTNLPLPSSRLIGRIDQIAGIEALLRTSDVRLVTLTGPGGVGKTRLLTHVAQDLLLEFQHGAWLVELAPLSNAEIIDQAIVSTLVGQGVSSKPPLDFLKDYLRDKRLLLLLDNCEHLLDASSRLAHLLLSTCPQLVILSTSREAFNIPEEFIWQVPPFSLPDLSALPPLAQLSENEAVSFFVDRSRHLQSGFQLTQHNAPAIATICCRLDGLPLAIELATAHLRVLSPVQILEKLDRALGLLEGGYRTASTRQQTMHATIAWSYDALSEPEQALLRRISVFSGGCTLQAAEDICSLEEVSSESNTEDSVLAREDVLVQLQKLVNKSLVIATIGKSNKMRYLLLETIRQFAGEKLLEAGEMEVFRQRHLDYYLRISVLAKNEVRSPDSMTWVVRMKPELDNIRTALSWSINEKRPSANEQGLLLANAFYIITHQHNSIEYRNWAEKGLAILCKENPSKDLVYAQTILLLGHALKNDEGCALMEESLALYRENPRTDPRELAYALLVLSDQKSYVQGAKEQSRDMIEECVSILRALGLEASWELAEALLFKAFIALWDGAYDVAQESGQESLELFQQAGSIVDMTASLRILAQAAQFQGDYETARRHFKSGLLLFDQIEPEAKEFTLKSYLLLKLAYANLEYQSGDYQAASQEYARLLTTFRDLGDRSNIGATSRYLGMALFFLGEIEPAIENLVLCLQMGRELKAEYITAAALAALALIFVDQGQAPAAARLLGASEIKSSTWGPVARLDYKNCLDGVKSALGEPDFDRLLAEGRAMTLEQAASYALKSLANL